MFLRFRAICNHSTCRNFRNLGLEPHFLDIVGIEKKLIDGGYEHADLLRADLDKLWDHLIWKHLEGSHEHKQAKFMKTFTAQKWGEDASTVHYCSVPGCILKDLHAGDCCIESTGKRKRSVVEPYTDAAYKKRSCRKDDHAPGNRAITSKYREVVESLRKQPEAKYFMEPMDWERLGMNDYLKLITHPMDLGTVLNKLKRYEYETVAALQADLDLIWDNAIRYNGEDSWMKKYVDHMRAVTSRKLEEAMAEPVRAMPSTAQAAVESFRTADESQVAEALLGFCGDVTVPPEKLSEALAEKERMLVAQDVAAPLQKWFDDHATEDDKSMCVLFTQHAEQVRQVEAKRNEEVAAVRTALNTLRRAEVALANAVSEVSLDSVAEAEAWFYTRVKAHGECGFVNACRRLLVELDARNKASLERTRVWKQKRVLLETELATAQQTARELL